jgi:GT2 family glycosyltransferase
MDLSIIIVSFNVKNLLRNCIDSIFRSRDGFLKEIILVDNNSEDGSKQYINELTKLRINGLKIGAVLNKKNLGFAKAVNQGIKIAKGKYILLLNPDTQVKKDSLEKLIDFAEEHPEAGAIGAQLVNPDNSVQPSVYHFPSCWRAILEFWFGKKGAYEKYAPLGNKPLVVDAVTGAAMLIPRKTFEKVGLFDERYFMYFEDLDFCRRVKKAGLKVYYLPEAKILHHHGQSAVKVGNQVYKWLSQSSKIYNGILKYWCLTGIIWLGERWRKRE